jgi:serine/threonine protein kinase
MLNKAGSTLLDFGLAKMSVAPAPGTVETRLLTSPSPGASGNLFGGAQSGPLTARGSILGTFQYMVPEQLEGQDADARTDIWAFGCVLYEIVTGNQTFEGKTQASLIAGPGVCRSRGESPACRNPAAREKRVPARPEPGKDAAFRWSAWGRGDGHLRPVVGGCSCTAGNLASRFVGEGCYCSRGYRGTGRIRNLAKASALV